MAELPWILGEAVRRGASDIHLKAGCPPIFRIATKLVTLDPPPLSPAETEALARSDGETRLIEKFLSAIGL